MTNSSKTLVFTATYNESGNIELLIEKIFENLPAAHILVVDDSSPDGTEKILDRLAERNSSLKVIHREGKMGLGSAHIVAMKYALQHQYEHLITMDADFSYDPKYLHELLAEGQENGFVIGSRYVAGGGLDYGFFRHVLSRTTNILSRELLGIPLRETTTSYRCFKLSLLGNLTIDKIHSDGYSFFIESLFFVSMVTDKLSEIPIHFEDRLHGKSKISSKEIYIAVLTLFRLALTRTVYSLVKVSGV